MNILIDTNIILDIAFERKPHHENAGFHRIFHNVDKSRYILPEILYYFTFKTVIEDMPYIIEDRSQETEDRIVFV